MQREPRKVIWFRHEQPVARARAALIPVLLLLGTVIEVRAQSEFPTLHMIGDSTMANKPLTPPQPERGWGQLLPIYLKFPQMVRNHAKNGRSSKSFISEGLWAEVLQSLEPGDFVLIQFGHNDQKQQSPERFADAAGDYRDNLKRFIRESQDRGAHPILATSVVRRRFDGKGQLVDTLGDYPQTVRDVGMETKVPVLDLHARSAELLTRYGVERSKQLFLWIDPDLFATVQESKHDDTHLSADGASRICELAMDELRRIEHPLAQFAR